MDPPLRGSISPPRPPHGGGPRFARFSRVPDFAIALGGGETGLFFGALFTGPNADRFGRRPIFAYNMLLLAVFAGAQFLVQTAPQLLALRLVIGVLLGTDYVVSKALLTEFTPRAFRGRIMSTLSVAWAGGYTCAYFVGYALADAGFDAWRWMLVASAVPCLLILPLRLTLPESPLWLAGRGTRRKAPAGPVRELLRPPLLRLTIIGIVLGSIPMVGAWAASKWMIPWADAVGGAASSGYKGVTQGWWALGAVLGSFSGAQIAARLGRRRAYALISFGAAALTLAMFLGTAPLQASFLPVVFAQGFTATLFFGWLPLYLPELFPTRVRATGQGLCFNFGRIMAAVGTFYMGYLVALFGGDYGRAMAAITLIYLVGMVLIWIAPETKGKPLPE